MKRHSVMDSNLYGKKKPTKIKGKEISSSNSLSFTSNLSSLISNSSTGQKGSSSRDKLKENRSKPDIFTAHKQAKKRKLQEDENGQRHQTEQDLGIVSRAELDRSKRRMQEKVRLYNAMKRGEYVASGDGYDDKTLVDFDRKWADKQHPNQDRDDTDSSEASDADEDEVNRGSEQIEYLDDFGRLRKGTKKDAERQKQKARIEAIAKQESLEFQARPQMPSNVIYGDTIQHQAYDPDRVIMEKMAELAKKRDKSATPPPASHFDASAEVRTKGTAFYTFSHDADQRQKEMDALEQTRRETERVRAERTGSKANGSQSPGNTDATADANPAEDNPKNSSEPKSDADRFLDSLQV